MNRSMIYVSACMAVGALLFPSFVDQAHAACRPPFDYSSCTVVPKETFVQASPVLPELPFLVGDPQAGNTFVVTDFDRGSKPPEPVGKNSCNASNVHACTSVSSVDLTNSAVAKQSAPFLVRFQDGRSMLASPMQ